MREVVHTCSPDGECFCVYRSDDEWVYSEERADPNHPLIAGPRWRETLERIRVCCDNGSEPLMKLAFIREITGKALGDE